MFKVGQRVWVKSDKCFGVVKSIDVYGIYYNVSFENSPLGKTTTINDLHETADDMFEKLGFEKERYNKIYGLFRKGDAVVDFELKEKIYQTFVYDEETVYDISPELHLAIHQKGIELGWWE